MKIANLKMQLEAHKNGIYLDSSGEESWCYNFYDWFCKDSSLKTKSDRLFGSLRTFLKYYPEVDQEKTYVFFKNNCPLGGPLYDDFRICDIETGRVIYNVTPKSGHTGKAEIYSSKNWFEAPIKTAESYKQLFKYK